MLGTFLWGSTRALMYGGVFMLVMLLLGRLRSPWAVLLPALLGAVGPLFAAPAIAWAVVTEKSFNNLFYYTELVISPMFFLLRRLLSGPTAAAVPAAADLDHAPLPRGLRSRAGWRSARSPARSWWTPPTCCW